MRGLIFGSAFATLLLGGAIAPAEARTSGSSLVPPGWSVGHVRVEGKRTVGERRVRRVALAGSDRPLTVRRRPEPDLNEDDDPLYSGGTHYNNIHLFDPFPSVDSGVQFPYGLDGVGGYGSDIGFSAGSDSALYDRGP